MVSPDHRFVSQGEGAVLDTGAGQTGVTWAYMGLLDLTGIEPMTTRVAYVVTDADEILEIHRQSTLW